MIAWLEAWLEAEDYFDILEAIRIAKIPGEEKGICGRRIYRAYN